MSEVQKTRRQKRRILLRMILLIIILLCCSYLGWQWYQRHLAANTYAVMSNLTLISDDEADGERADENKAPRKNFDSYQDDSFKGWIYAPETPIDYPVMGWSDNQYYLFHLPDGTYNTCGSIFMDYRNSQDIADDNTILYGHYMRNGTMFAAVDQYSSQSFYDQHPVMFFYTRDKIYMVELFAGYVADASSSLPIQCATSEEFMEFIHQAKDKSVFTSGVTPDSGDQLMTLVTCDYSWDDARFILIGRLVLR